LGDVSGERNRGVVAVVGGAIADGGEAMARALQALGDVRIHMLSLSATGINLTMVVDDEQVTPAIRRLHDAFFPEEAPV
jgi:aspartate kinase